MTFRMEDDWPTEQEQEDHIDAVEREADRLVKLEKELADLAEWESTHEQPDDLAGLHDD